MVKAVLLKPLNGQAIGEDAEFSQADFDTLEALGAVKRDGPARVAPKSPQKKGD